MTDTVEKTKVEFLSDKLKKVIEGINATELGKIEIDGKKYTTVATRIEFFRKEFGFEAQIITDLINVDEESVIAKADIGFFKKNQWFCVATGYAEEKRGTSKLNEASALEIAETSAIGRALSNLGLGGGEFASANEVMNSKDAMSENSKPENKKNEEKKEDNKTPKENKPATNAQKEVIKSLINETNTRVPTFLKKHKVSNIDGFTSETAEKAISELKDKKEAKDKANKKKPKQNSQNKDNDDEPLTL